MPSIPKAKQKKLRVSALEKYEAERNLAADLVESIQDMKKGRVRVLSSPAINARQGTGLSQSEFAALLGVSVRTLQGWEQGRKQPSGAARTLLAIVRRNPRLLIEARREP